MTDCDGRRYSFSGRGSSVRFCFDTLFVVMEDLHYVSDFGVSNSQEAPVRVRHAD